MKLRSIRLENVRRFIDPVEITGIGDGLNVLAAPNEHGKSTVFDALHAVFFKDRKSLDKKVKSLIPHAGGDPAVTVEIEWQGEKYRIVKRWSKRRGAGDARIMVNGRVMKQADDAEAWIAAVLKTPQDGGPAGLLWVRQGLAGLVSGDKKLQDAENQARRGLVTSVAGEVEAVTGGRKMDMARDRCRQERDRYVTKTGQPKAGGALKNKEKEFDELSERHNELKAKSRQLREELDRRRTLRRELAGLEDPKERQQREERLEKAESGYAEAARHAEQVERARQKLSAKRLERDRASEQVVSLERDLSECKKAREDLQLATDQAARNSAELRSREGAMAAAEQALAQVRRLSEEAADTLQRVLRAQVAAVAAQRRDELREKLAQAEALRQQLEEAKAAARVEITDQNRDRLEAQHEELRVLEHTRDAEAAAITMTYSPGRSTGVSLGGEPLVDAQRTLIPNGAQLDIDGIGLLTIHPGRRVDDESLAVAREAFARALATVGKPNIAEVRASGQRKRKADERRRDAEIALQATIPDGIDALREEIATLPDPIAVDQDLPTSAQAQDADREAKEELAKVTEQHAVARAKLDRAGKAHARASAAVESAQARLERARAAVAPTADPDDELRQRREVLARLGDALQEATLRCEELEAQAPDLTEAEATLERARSIVRNAEDARQRIRIELGKLDTTIELRAGEAVDEELADTVVRMESVQQELHRLRFEVKMLKKLGETLKIAQQSARDRYVRPVLKELEPLLRLLWPEVKIQFDAETMLPTALVRAGTEEDFDILSGGTQEQIALLVRLAFARLLANAGTPAPVILDDAIVYTDDNRIETVFDALTRQAQDLQIIVFSCRQKAFRDLGGRSLSIESAGPSRGGQ